MTSISDYGLIGNTRTAALVSKSGSIDWCCFPRFDSPSFFARLLDDEGGYFQICPQDNYHSEQKYLEDTNVLETVFTTSTGTVRLLDSFTVASEKDKKKELSPTHEILRVVECLGGSVLMKFAYDPAPGYGKAVYKTRETNRLGLRCEFGSEVVVLNHDLNTSEHFFELQQNERKIFSLSYNYVAPGVLPALDLAAIERLERTVLFWRNWIGQCHYDGSYQSEVRRSALTLKLLVFSPSGAIVASPTTSLPEEIRGVKNWDYRYCWLRDAAFTIRSFLGLGFQEEARAYMGWILHTTALTRPRLKVLYNVYGESHIPEKIITWFKGYKDSQPVRIGNAADAQFQLDVYGEVMDAAYAYSESMEKFDHDSVTFLTEITDSVCKLWEWPDEGIWEIRSGKVHHTHSKAMAALALKRFIQLASRFQWKVSVEKYQVTYKKIIDEIETQGHNSVINSYTRCFDDDQLDASLLILPIFLDDLDRDRLQNTTIKILETLVRNGLTYRYLGVNDGVPGSEGAFGACSFWMVEALSKLGEKVQAKNLMEELLKKENPLGLWSEEINPDDNEYLGNYPQAFTHTALINAALSLQGKAA